MYFNSKTAVKSFDLNPFAPSFLSCALTPLIFSLQNCDHNKSLAHHSISIPYYSYRIWDSQWSFAYIERQDSTDNFNLNYDFFDYKVATGSSCLLLQNKLIIDLDDSPLLWLTNFLSKVLSSYSGLQEDGNTNSSKVLISMKLPKRCHNTILPPPSTIKPQSYISFSWKFCKSTKSLCWMCACLYAAGPNLS